MSGFWLGIEGLPFRASGARMTQMMESQMDKKRESVGIVEGYRVTRGG